MSRAKQVVDSVNPLQCGCNTLAMNVIQTRNQPNVHNERVTRETQAWQSQQNYQNQIKTTYCDKIGTRTICNYY